MDIPLYNQNAESVGTVTLPERVFNVPMNADLLHQVVQTARANQRQVLAHAKTRSEVRGGGKKPWRQKGTGRARHGSIRSPIWKGGGVSGGPTKDRNFSKKINKKMAAKALGVALSSKVRDGEFALLDTLALDKPKTKLMSLTLRKLSTLFLGATVRKNPSSILVVVPAGFQELSKSIRNIPFADVIEARNVNPLTLLGHTYVIALKDTVETFQKLMKVS